MSPSAYKVTFCTSKHRDVDNIYSPTPENMAVDVPGRMECVKENHFFISHLHFSLLITHFEACLSTAKAFGQLVQLGFDVAVFTPAAYQRPRLGRPCVEFSS